MRTISFIGSDKNAGKTTAMNFVRTKMKNKSFICLTSIGINGEEIDTLEGSNKPTIEVHPANFFLTSSDHLTKHTGKYEIIEIFGRPLFKKDFVLAKAIMQFNLILEGPNEKEELLQIKEWITAKLPRMLLLIDGSIDRQFLAHPKISDAFYFVLLISNRKEQLAKANNLLTPLSFAQCNDKIKVAIHSARQEDYKSILLDETMNFIYHSHEIPTFDEQLKKLCLLEKDRKKYLYINGAFSKSMATWPAMSNTSIILDNFTLFQDITIDDHRKNPNLDIQLYHAVEVKKIFLNQQMNAETFPLNLPVNIPICNIYRENFDAIGI